MKSVTDSRQPLTQEIRPPDEAKSDLLNKLKTSYIPPYVAIFRAIPCIGRCPAIFQVIIYGLVLLIVSHLVATITNITAKLVQFWMYVGVAATIIGVGLWALWYVRRRTMVVIKEVANMMTSAEQIAKLDSCLELMYSYSKLQLMSAIGFPVIVGILILSLDILNLFPKVTFPRFLKLYAGTMVSLCVTVAGFGLWLAIASSIFIYQFTNKGKGYAIRKLILGPSLCEKTIPEIGEIKFNPLLPARTVGIVQLANLMAMYSTLFTLEISLFSIPFAMVHFGIGLHAPSMVQSLLPYKIIVTIVLFLSLVVVPTYLIYPQWALRGMVIDKKNEAKQRIQKEIQDLHFKKGRRTSDDLVAMEKYIQMFKEVDNSPNMPINVGSLVASILSIALSIALALLGNPQVLANLIQFVRRIMESLFQ